MLKIIVITLQALVGVYLAGNIARQNPKFDAFVTLLEDGYGSLNNKIKDAHLQSGIHLLRRLYGWVSILVVVLFIIMGFIKPAGGQIYSFLSFVFMISLVGWGSISWCTQHRETVEQNLGWALLFIFSPFALGLLERLSDISLLWPMLMPAIHILELLGITVEPSIGTWILACILSGLFFLMVVVQYCCIWLIAIPIMSISAVIVAALIAFAKFINKMAPQKAFGGLMVVAFITLTLLQLTF